MQIWSESWLYAFVCLFGAKRCINPCGSLASDGIELLWFEWKKYKFVINKWKEWWWWWVCIRISSCNTIVERRDHVQYLTVDCTLKQWLMTFVFFLRAAKPLIRLGRCPISSEFPRCTGHLLDSVMNFLKFVWKLMILARFSEVPSQKMHLNHFHALPRFIPFWKQCRSWSAGLWEKPADQDPYCSSLCSLISS